MGINVHAHVLPRFACNRPLIGKSSEKTFRTYPKLSKQYYITIIKLFPTLLWSNLEYAKSRIFPESHIFYWNDPNYSDFTRILPVTQIQYTQAYSIHFKSICYTMKLLSAPEY